MIFQKTPKNQIWAPQKIVDTPSWELTYHLEFVNFEDAFPSVSSLEGIKGQWWLIISWGRMRQAGRVGFVTF